MTKFIFEIVLLAVFAVSEIIDENPITNNNTSDLILDM